MKVAMKRPELVEKPVYVDDYTYEMWYMKPVYLGKITRPQNRFVWNTADGNQFLSSRAALKYLISKYESGTLSVGSVPAGNKPVSKSVPPAITRKVVPAHSKKGKVAAPKKKAAPASKKPTIPNRTQQLDISGLDAATRNRLIALLQGDHSPSSKESK